MHKRFILLFCLSACAIGPSLQTPEIALPKSYTNSVNTQEKIQDLTKWWTHFGDAKLNGLIELAKTRNFDVLIAMDRIEQARALYRIKTGELWPSIDFNASALRTRFSENLFFSEFLSDPEQSVFQLGFDAIWECDLFGFFRKQKQAARYTVLEQEAHLADVLLLIYADVAKTYVEICALQQDISTIEEIVKTAKQIFFLLEVEYESGLISRQELEKARSFVKQQQVLSITRKTILQKLYQKLTTLLADPMENASARFSGEEKIPTASLQVAVGMPSELLRRRPDIRKAECRLASENRLLGSAVADLFPRFSLIADLGLAASKIDRWFASKSRAWSITPFLHLPVFHFGRILGKIDEQDAKLTRAIHEYKQSVLLALEDTENALNAYIHSVRIQELRRDIFISQEEQTFMQQQLMQSGIKRVVSYLQKKLSFLDAQRSLIEAKRTESVQLIALYKALGGGWSC